MSFPLTRRTFVRATLAAGGLAVAGCGARERKASEAEETARTETPSDPQAKLAAMTVYRDPSCGCCKAWADIARNAGYEVTLIDHSDMPAIKRQYGVPEELLSCHTAVVDGYAVEGHVPLDDVKRLLAERPAGIRGIAVAGMPMGSPGMEVPDGTKQPFQVMAFGVDGKTSDYRG